MTFATQDQPGDAERIAIIEEDAAEGAEVRREALAEVLAERFGPDARPAAEDAARARAVAAIHALAQFYADNPLFPVPDHVVGGSKGESLEHVVHLADVHGTTVYGEPWAQMDVEIHPLERGCWVLARVSARPPVTPL